MNENFYKISAAAGENLVFQNGKKYIQFFPGGAAAQGNPESAVDEIGIGIHGGHHMAPVSLCAGGTGGYADAMVLQDVDAVLGGHSGDSQGKNVGCFMGAVDHNSLCVFQRGY